MVLIVNAAAGRGRARRVAGDIARVAAGHGVHCAVVAPTSPAATRAAAEAAASGGARAVGAVGGDGTVHHVVAGLAAAGARTCALLVAPTGTGNDYARALQLPRRPEASAALLWDGLTSHLDLMDVAGVGGHSLGVLTVSAGFDAEVAALRRSAGRVPAPYGYPLAILRALPRLRPRELRVTLDDLVLEGRFLFVAVNVGSCYGAGLRITPAARPDDGWLDVAIAGAFSRWEALRTWPRLYTGSHVTHPLFHLARARRVRIDGEPAPAQVDGEPSGTTPLEIAVRPAALPVLLPAAMARALGGPAEQGETGCRDGC